MAPPRRPPARPSPRRPAAPRGRAASRTRTRRIRALTGIACLLIALLGVRAAWIGTVRAGDLAERGREAQRADVTLLAPRGTLISSDGAELAVDQLAVDVSASPMTIQDPVGVARKLAPILKRDPNVLAEALSGEGGYALLARAVRPAAADTARALGIPGIHFTDTYRRFLPNGRRSAQVLGLTGAEHQGLSGLEARYDERLTGVPGRRLEVRDVFGRPIQVLSDTEAEPGEDVRLSINSEIQAHVAQVLARTRSRYSAKSAMAIVMDPHDGSILAMASVPGFNPNDRRELDPELERNRPVVDVFEPGSTFKIVPMVAALEDDKLTPSTAIAVPASPIKLYDGTFTLRDAHPHGAQTRTATQIMEESSNIGFYKISLRVGRQRLQDWMDALGFGAPTGVDFPGEVPGYIPPGDRWFGTGIATFPIGQGVTVTLTQLARAYAAIANGGMLVQPHLVADDDDAPAPRRVMSATTARQVDRMLRKVVSERGTGTLAEVRGYDVAGKTGTAEKIDPETGRYSETAYYSSFIGYAPADDPRLLVGVVVDEPGGGNYYGGEVAAPAFAEIAEFSLQKLRISP